MDFKKIPFLANKGMANKGVTSSRKTGKGLLGTALCVSALAFSGTSLATDYVVNTTDDLINNDSTISLREAITAANTNAASGSATTPGEADGDTITFSVSGTITLTSALPTISEDLVITGTPGILIDGTDTFQILSVDASGETVVLDQLRLTNGSAEDGGAVNIAAGSTVTSENLTVTSSQAVGGAEATQGGGAIFNAGTLTLDSPTLMSNTATDGSASGGAINNSGAAADLTINGGTITGNEANRAGGGIENTGSITMDDVTLDNNIVNNSPGNGGGFHTGGTGTLTMTGGTVNGNTAGAEGGGLWNSGAGSSMTITDTTIDGNTASGDDADQGGGGIFNGGADGDGGTLTLTNVTVTNNIADGTAGSGGGILNFGGVLDVTGGMVNNNRANRAGGGIESTNDTGDVTLSNVNMLNNNVGFAPAVAAPGNGGALHITGSGDTEITGGTVSGNRAAAEGGGLWNGSGTMDITGVTIDNNTASGLEATQGGGGLFNNGGTMNVVGGSITNNTATNDDTTGRTSGGGILNDNGILTVNPGSDGAAVDITGNTTNRAGGGIETINGTVTLNNVNLSNNDGGTRPGNGGGLHVSGATATVDIAEDSLIDNNIAGSEGGGLWNGGGSNVMTLTGPVTISNNVANGTSLDEGGGGIFNGGANGDGGTLDATDVIIRDNMAVNTSASGGGILNFGGTVTMLRGVITGNSAARAGGGFEDNSNSADNTTTVTIDMVTVDGNDVGSNPGNGGGLHIGGAGSVTVNQSTFSGNTAAKEGGGLWNSMGGTLTINNSTVSGNTANGSTTGGGGVFTQGGQTTLNNVTVASNSANFGGGVQDIELSSNGGLDAANAIIGDNSAGTGPDIEGPITANDSVIENTTGGTVTGSNNVNADPALGPLTTDNGGLTATHALQAGSPAIDLGDSGVCSGTDVNDEDQRGVTRPAACDAGAFELVDLLTAETTNNAAGSTEITAGTQDATGVGFTIDNGDNAEAVTINGFSGTFTSRGDFEEEIVNIEVFLDSNGDGAVDGGDTPIAATASLSTGSQTFTVEFATARMIAAGATESYILAVDFDGQFAMLMPTVLMAGGSLLLLPLLLVAWRRRSVAFVTLCGGAMLLSACGGSADFRNDDNDVDNRAFVQFTVTSVDGEDSSGELALFESLPITGPRLIKAE